MNLVGEQWVSFKAQNSITMRVEMVEAVGIEPTSMAPKPAWLLNLKSPSGSTMGEL